jgi:phosphoglycolate phosphatase-like HAD superfamily hydrolase
MDAATFTPADLRKRDEIAERLLRREKKIAEDLRLIDEDKDALRALSDKAGEGFTVEIKDLGTVAVTGRREKELTGTSPQLVIAHYLGLTEARRKKLVADGLVEIVEVWKKAAKPSVTVRL